MNCRTDQWLLTDQERRGNLNVLLYSTCHSWQLWRYFKHTRHQDTRGINLRAAVLHLIEDEPQWRSSPALPAQFEWADVIIYHAMNPTRFPGLMIDAMPVRTDRLIKIPSPQASCFWPIAPFGGELPIQRLISAGVPLAEARRRYHVGELDFCYDERMALDVERIAQREEGYPVQIAPFIRSRYQDVKLFLTSNHPTYHLASCIGDQILRELGLPFLGEDHWASVGVNEAEFRNHFPETESEFRHYGFIYPIRWPNEFGGHDFYLGQIDRIYEEAN